MLSFECLFCEGKVRLEKMPKAGQKLTCPACHRLFEVVSTSPLQLKPESNAFETDWENPEKQARSKRLELRTKLEVDVDEEFEILDDEMVEAGKMVTTRAAGKRSQRPKRIRGYAFDYDDESLYED